jgi:hypothetical protein
VLDGRTGRDLRGWPQPIQVIPGQSVASESSPTVADLDHNGRKEIIIGAGSIDVPGQQGGVVAFNANGSVRWRIRTATVAGENGVVSTPAVGDVDGDGFPDVVFGSFDHHIYAVNRNGNALPGFPMDTLETIWDPRSTTRVGSAGWTSSSAVTRVRVVRAATSVGPASCARFASRRRARACCGRTANTRSSSRARRSGTSAATAGPRS